MAVVDAMMTKRSEDIGRAEPSRASSQSASPSKAGAITEGIIGPGGAPSKVISNLMKRPGGAVLR